MNKLLQNGANLIALILLCTPGFSQAKIESKAIGNQTWMAKNLQAARFANGEPILEAKSKTEWEKAGKNQKPAWCYYNNDPANGIKFGKLYNWYAVADPRGLCPAGWHVPSDKEFSTMEKFLGGTPVAGGKIKTTGTKKAGKGFWNSPNKGANNTSGFSGLPGGARYYGGKFSYISNLGSWWSSTEQSKTSAWYRYLYYGYADSFRYLNSKNYGFSVRCIRN